MDEQIEAIYMIAIECLANLIAPKKDEVNRKKTEFFLNKNLIFSRKCFLKQYIGHVDIINQI
jgi:hypothetical protein